MNQNPAPVSAAAVAAFESACPVIEQAVVARALSHPEEVAQHGQPPRKC